MRTEYTEKELKYRNSLRKEWGLPPLERKFCNV